MELTMKKITICLFMILALILIIMTKSYAVQEYSELNGKWFYIKKCIYRSLFRCR